jgi:folate-binding protein YgfZ
MIDAYRHALEDAALFDLADRGLVELAGKDAVSFLHNLCTNDIKGLPAGASCEAFLTNVKARVIAHGFVSRLQQDGLAVLWLDLVAGLAPKVLEHLDHHLISEEVELADRSGAVAQMYLCGPRARRLLDSILAAPLPELPELHQAPALVSVEVTGHVRRHDYLGLPGYDLFFPRSAADNLRQTLTSAGAVLAGRETYEILRVEAGFPAFGPDIDEDRFVVEVGRARQAICYTKGCYLGQEPIVMARDRGHVNRTLLGLKLAAGEPVPAAARVFRGAEEVGTVTSSVRSPRLGTAIALAYLRRGSQEPGTAVEVEMAGTRRPAVVTALPLVATPEA